MLYTGLVACKLLLTATRYYFYKKDNREHIGVYLSDLIVMNVLMTAIFLRANFMYFSPNNFCSQTND